METVNKNGTNNKQDSILKSIKKLIGLTDDYTIFDEDIIVHINTVFAKLIQMGIGPKDGFSISDDTAKWEDFLGEDTNRMQEIKSYVYINVRLIFDPPTNATLMQSLKDQAKELEWRMYIEKGNY